MIEEDWPPNIEKNNIALQWRQRNTYISRSSRDSVAKSRDDAYSPWTPWCTSALCDKAEVMVVREHFFPIHKVTLCNRNVKGKSFVISTTQSFYFSAWHLSTLWPSQGFAVLQLCVCLFVLIWMHWAVIVDENVSERGRSVWTKSL